MTDLKKGDLVWAWISGEEEPCPVLVLSEPTIVHMPNKNGDTFPSIRSVLWGKRIIALSEKSFYKTRE